jgi:hypothetical protein
VRRPPHSTIGSDRCAGAALDGAFASLRNPDLCLRCSGIFRGVAATNYCRQQDERQPASLAVRHTSQHQLAYTFPALGTARVASSKWECSCRAFCRWFPLRRRGLVHLVDRARSRENRDQQVKFPTNDRVSTTRPPSPGFKSPHWSEIVSSDASEDSIDNCLGVLVTEGRRPQ